jgi:hypothetical protein
MERYALREEVHYPPAQELGQQAGIAGRMADAGNTGDPAAHTLKGTPPADQLQTTRANLVQDTNGQLKPRYEVVERQVGHLVCGDLVIEPILGEVRVVQVAELDYDPVRHLPLLQVYWIADSGLSTAARLFPANATVSVRVPALEDRVFIKHGIDQAAYANKEIDARTARTIAAQLQRGPGTALYAFAVSGAITDRLYDELDEVTLNPSPQLRLWVDALARYALAREDQGPVVGWGWEGW